MVRQTEEPHVDQPEAAVFFFLFLFLYLSNSVQFNSNLYLDMDKEKATLMATTRNLN